MKRLDELWKEFDKKKGKLSSESIEDLRLQVDHKGSLYESIAAARDMIIETEDREHLEQELVPTIAKHFDHEDRDIRAIAVGTVIGICKAARYGEQALFFASSDPDNLVRVIATSCLGWIMNIVDPKLAREMAVYLYKIMTNQDDKNYKSSDRGAAKESILISMEVYYPDWGRVNFDEVWEVFVERYALEKLKGCKGKKKKSKAKYQ